MAPVAAKGQFHQPAEDREVPREVEAAAGAVQLEVEVEHQAAPEALVLLVGHAVQVLAVQNRRVSANPLPQEFFHPEVQAEIKASIVITADFFFTSS